MYGRAIAVFAFLFLCGFFALAACRSAEAATVTDSSIAVAGNRHVDGAMVRSHFHAGADGRLTEATLDAALKSLYATGLFLDVKISRDGGRVLVTVVENPTIDRIVFEGDKKLKGDDLKKVLQSKSGGPLSRAIVHDDVAHIIELYRQRGYFAVRVDPKTIRANNERVALVFEIKEGDKLAVRQIQFVGNEAYPANKLQGVIKIGETNVLSFLLDNDTYDADRIENDLDLIRRFYLAHGYADMRVRQAASYQQNIQSFALRLGFHFQRRPRFKTGNLHARRKTKNSAISRRRAPRSPYGSSAAMALLASSLAISCERGNP